MLFPILQISAAVLLAVFGTLGMLNAFRLSTKILFVFLVFSPVLLRILLCMIVSMRETKKFGIAFSADRENVKQAKAFLGRAIEAYSLIDFRDWGRIDLLICLLQSGCATDLRAALQKADSRIGSEGLAEAERSASAAVGVSGEVDSERLKDALERSLGRLNDDSESLWRVLRDNLSVPSLQLAEQIGRSV